MNKNLKDHLEGLNNLPDCIKDFHDQKDLFKTIWSWWGSEIEKDRGLNWVDAMTFTIDNFLWFMGMHGYKLQRDKTKNVEFKDLHESINFAVNKRREKFVSVLKKEAERQSDKS